MGTSIASNIGGVVVLSIDRRNCVFPEWEPIPWNAQGPEVDEQEGGFQQRATLPLFWKKIAWTNFPDQGIFGCSQNWLRENEIEYVAEYDGEELILIDNIYHGFPDPPRWGLGSRPVGQTAEVWKLWGHFPHLPAAWQFADGDDPRQVAGPLSDTNSRRGLAWVAGLIRGLFTNW